MLPHDIDHGPFEPDPHGSKRATLIVVLSLFGVGLSACVLAFAFLR